LCLFFFFFFFLLWSLLLWGRYEFWVGSFLHSPLVVALGVGGLCGLCGPVGGLGFVLSGAFLEGGGGVLFSGGVPRGALWGVVGGRGWGAGVSWGYAWVGVGVGWGGLLVSCGGGDCVVGRGGGCGVVRGA